MKLFEISKLEYSENVSEIANNNLIKYFVRVKPTETSELLKLPKTPHILYEFFRDEFDSIANLEIRNDDVFICGLLKCGTSWLQNIVWLLTHNLDYETNRNVDRKHQMCNFDRIIGDAIVAERYKPHYEQPWIENVAGMKSPRIFKTHLPVQCLPKEIWSKGAKVICIVRNPKDMIASEYHYVRNMFGFDVTMDDLVNGIVTDSWLLCPRMEYNLDFWKIKHLPNVHFVAYEDLVSDTFATIKQISEFLDKQYNDEQLEELVEYSSFDNMKKIKTINRESELDELEKTFGKRRQDSEFSFHRKGKIGSYQNEFNEQQMKKLDNWIEKSLKGTDFKYKN